MQSLAVVLMWAAAAAPPAQGGYRVELGYTVQVQALPVKTALVSLGSPRALFLTQRNCPPCEPLLAALEKGAFVSLRKGGWKIGREPGAHILIVSLDEHPELWGLTTSTPAIVHVNKTTGEVDRRLDVSAGVPTMPDLFWVATGERPKPAPAAKPAAPTRVTYPTAPAGGVFYNGCDSWEHLTQYEHAGKFDPTWLKQLSDAEIQALHADDHTNRVRWNNVVRMTVRQQSGGQPRIYQYCPTCR